MGCMASKYDVECPTCDDKIQTGSAFLRHLESKHHYKKDEYVTEVHLTNDNIASPKCPTCDYKIHTGSAFLRHVESKHNYKKDVPVENVNVSANDNITCPKCGCGGMTTIDLLDHLEQNHSFLPNVVADDVDTLPSRLTCPKCNVNDLISVTDMVNHLEKVHSFAPHNDEDELSTSESPHPDISCPKCDESGFLTGDEFLEHLETSHAFGREVDSPTLSDNVDDSDNSHSNLPKVGDKVLAMWSGSIWQYFQATIIKFMKDDLKYEIIWDDKDPSGRIVDYFNLAVDRVPLPHEIGIGSIILFLQGHYGGKEGVRTGGERWHQGRITKVYEGRDGTKMYDGCHTKGGEDGKWVTFSGYAPTFTGYKIDDFRVGPNVFDIIGDDNDTSLDAGDIDIYFSYSPVDSPKAIKNNEVNNVPKSYRDVLDNLCDPMEIASKLKAKGLKVVVRKVTADTKLKNTVKLMKKATVFVACISDQYVLNDQCRMEFQFAKTSLGKPIVPLVVGDGSFEWTVSVVGMLIAGELYIHYKNKAIENAKNEELFRSLKSHLPNMGTGDITHGSVEEESVVEGPADIFISYCWTNSLKAEKAQQVEKCIGTEFSDARLISKTISDLGYSCWLDIERLQSRSNDAGMYEQLTRALRDAKIILPCVSTEYANSANCRMEFQFGLKSLGKPVIPIVVGDDDNWRQTVIGALVSTIEHDIIDLQCIKDEIAFQTKINLLKKQIDRLLGTGNAEDHDVQEKPSVAAVAVSVLKRRAPKVGDHVVCHHFKYAYYLATVNSFDKSRMEYSITWDDGDPSGRVQPFNQVAVDVIPDADDVGVSSIIFFPQGRYSGTDGNNEAGQRYHEGIVTSVRKEDGQCYFSGHHTKGDADEKWITYQSYNYNFNDLTLSQIRIAPTALDAFTG